VAGEPLPQSRGRHQADGDPQEGRSQVVFDVDDASAIRLLTESALLEANRANKDGVVTAPVQIEGKAKTAAANEHLENLLSFYFKLKSRLSGGSAAVIKRPPGRPRKIL